MERQRNEYRYGGDSMTTCAFARSGSLVIRTSSAVPLARRGMPPSTRNTSNIPTLLGHHQRHRKEQPDILLWLAPFLKRVGVLQAYPHGLIIA